jgi:ethanolamine transporter
MTINQIVMYVLAFGAALGGIDHLLGNRWGYGERFESGFRMMGTVALAMAGVICVSPVISLALEWTVGPLCDLLHLDPAIFGTVLSTDMGGYQLSVELARDPRFGLLCSFVICSIFGCTVVYSIPVGLGFLKEEDWPYFTKGILLGLTAMPAAIIVACLMLKMNLGATLWNCMPVFLLSLALGVGVMKKPDLMIRGFRGFAKLIRKMAILGLMLGAVSHLSGLTLIPKLMPLKESMQIIISLSIAMLGSMPLSELIQRILKVPFEKINKKVGINGAGTTSLLLSMFGATPALALLPGTNHRGQIVISACLVSLINTFGAHFVMANTYAPEVVPAMIVSKVVGALVAGAISLYATRDMKPEA